MTSLRFNDEATGQARIFSWRHARGAVIPAFEPGSRRWRPNTVDQEARTSLLPDPRYSVSRRRLDAGSGPA
jgi:hypothetical protein